MRRSRFKPANYAKQKSRSDMAGSGGDERMEEEHLLDDDEVDYEAELEEAVKSGYAAPLQASTGRSEPGGAVPSKGDIEAVVVRVLQDKFMPQIVALVQGGTGLPAQVSAGGGRQELTSVNAPLGTPSSSAGPAAYSSVVGRRLGDNLAMTAEFLEPFHPEEEDANIERWLSMVDRLGDIHEWTAVERSYFTHVKLRGAAKAWFNRQESFDKTWGGWKDTLRQAFSRKKDFAAKIVELVNRRKLTSESMSRYYHAKAEL